MSEILNLCGLFVSALLAATVLPAQSEAVLAGLHLTGNYSATLLVIVATIGNVLGSCVNRLIGMYLARFQGHKWFFVKEAHIARAMRVYRRFGVWSLLFAWVPVIGDPLTVIAGLLRTPLFLFLTLVTIGKAGRYIVIVSALS